MGSTGTALQKRIYDSSNPGEHRPTGSSALEDAELMSATDNAVGGRPFTHFRHKAVIAQISVLIPEHNPQNLPLIWRGLVLTAKPK
jgi:hypothetical protein